MSNLVQWNKTFAIEQYSNIFNVGSISNRNDTQLLTTLIHYGVFRILFGFGSTIITNVNAKYADADFDEWSTPEQEASDIGTGTPNIWPNYSGTFAVQDFAFVGSPHLYNSDDKPKSQYLVTSTAG